MVNYYITQNGTPVSIQDQQNGCWISMIAPNEDEIAKISTAHNIDPDAIKAALDIDERSRIETDENYTMILVNIPIVEAFTDEKELYNTLPLSIITVNDVVITVCSQDTPILHQFTRGKVKDFHTNMKSRFIFQLLHKISSFYLLYLRVIDRKSEEVETQLHKSTRNQELIELLKLEKSLVYFTTALRSNEVVLEKLMRLESIKKYPDDADLLEDVIVENRQAIEMANIYSGILSGTMDAFASVISNNLNIVMKILAVITIVMSIPTMIFSAYGMNLQLGGMPFAQNPYGFLIIVAIALALSAIVALLFKALKMFR